MFSTCVLLQLWEENKPLMGEIDQLNLHLKALLFLLASARHLFFVFSVLLLWSSVGFLSFSGLPRHLLSITFLTAARSRSESPPIRSTLFPG